MPQFNDEQLERLRKLSAARTDAGEAERAAPLGPFSPEQIDRLRSISSGSETRGAFDRAAELGRFAAGGLGRGIANQVQGAGKLPGAMVSDLAGYSDQEVEELARMNIRPRESIQAFRRTLQDVAPSQDNAVTRFGARAEGAVNEALGQPESDDLVGQIADAVGQVGAFLISAPLRGLGTVGRATQTATTVTQAAGGGAQEAAERADMARLRGEDVSDDQRNAVIRAGGAIGLSDLAPVERLLRFIPARLTGEAASTVTGALRRIAAQGTLEGAQEAFSEVAQDLAQKGIYDEDLEVGQSMLDALVIGGGAGAVVQGILEAGVRRGGPNATLARELQRQLEGGEISPEEAASAFREQASREATPSAQDTGSPRSLTRSERAARDAGIAGTVGEARGVLVRGRPDGPELLPSPAPAPQGFTVDSDGRTIANSGPSRAASEEALLREQISENRRRTGAEEAVRMAGERAADQPRQLRGSEDADLIVDPDGRVVRPQDRDDLESARADAEAFREFERRRLSGERALPNPNAAGADFIAGEAGAVRSSRIDDLRLNREARERMRMRDELAPRDEAPAPRRLTTEDQMQRLREGPAQVASEAPAAELPKPRLIKTRKASEIYGVDKGGTVVATPQGQDVLVWKDDGTGMWNVSFPSETRLPDMTNFADTRAELIERVQTDLPGLVEFARTPAGQPAFTPDQVAQVRGEPQGAAPQPPTAEPAFTNPDRLSSLNSEEDLNAEDAAFDAPVDDAPVDDALFDDEGEGLYEQVEREYRRLAATSDDGSVDLRSLTEAFPGESLEDIAEVLAEIIPANTTEGRREQEVAISEPEAEADPDAEISIPVGEKALDNLRALSQTLEERGRVVQRGKQTRLEMSIEDAELVIAELEDSGGGRNAMAAIRSIESAMEKVLGTRGPRGGSYPYDGEMGGSSSPTADSAAKNIADDIRVASADMDLSAEMRVFDSTIADELTADEVSAVASALADLESRGMNLDRVLQVRFFAYQDGEYTGLYSPGPRAVGLDSLMIRDAARGGQRAMASLRSILAHELGHDADQTVTPGRSTLSSRHQGLSLSVDQQTGEIIGAGEAMLEAARAYVNPDSPLSEFFSYPFDDVPGLVESRVTASEIVDFLQGEVFAQGHALYYTDRETLRKEAPQLFRIVEETTNAAGFAGEAGRSNAGRAPAVQGEVRGQRAPEGEPRSISRSGSNDRADQAGDRVGRSDSGRNASVQDGPLLGGQEARQDEGSGPSAGSSAAEARSSGDVVRERDGRTQAETEALYAEARRALRDEGRNEALILARDLHPEFSPNTSAQPAPGRQSGIAARYEALQAPSSSSFSETDAERAVFESYLEAMSEVLEEAGVTDYRSLVEASYAKLGEEVQEQYDALVDTGIRLEWHPDGRGDYADSTELVADALLRRHMWVFQGGDVHPYLGATDETGLSLNEKFRAVHDYFGHVTSGATFGPQGEERAWANHVQMFSPLARIAMSAETRGQNSWVNFSGENDAANRKFKEAAAARKAYRETGDETFLDDARRLGEEGRALFSFAEQKEIALPFDDLRDGFADLEDGGSGTIRAGKTSPHGLKPEYLTTARGNTDKRGRVLKEMKPGNANAVMEALDKAAQKHADPLESEAAWLRFERAITGENIVPRPPYGLIKRVSDIDAWAQSHSRLTREQVAAVDAGLNSTERVRRLYESGDATPMTTAKLMLWGMLSRKASAYPQESAYLDLARGPRLEEFFDRALTREWTQEDVSEWRDWIDATLPEGSPGRSAVDNAKGFGGFFLLKMSARADGTSALEKLHDMLMDQSLSTTEIRRRFQSIAPGNGIGNKVFSFTMLVAGRHDLVILDRIQINSFWDSGRYGKSIYDDFVGVTDGAQGLARYEALERSLQRHLPEMYSASGRPGQSSVGRFHWENWVLESGQVVAHPTIDAIDVAPADMADIVAREGRWHQYAFGSSYGVDEAGRSFILYPDSEGAVYRFTPNRFREMLDEVKKPRNGVVPTRFSVKSFRDAGFPWYESESVNRSKLDELVKSYGQREEASRGAGSAGLVQAPDADVSGPIRRFGGRRDRGVQPDAGRDRPTDDRGQVRVPRYGRGSAEGAVTVRARHYSHQQRGSLSGDQYGTGLRGEERRRLAGAPDELKQRIYFYVDDGAGITPEPGVGDFAHEVELTNIYDLRSRLIDPNLTPNEFEMEVIRRRYDGYMAKFPGSQRAVVLLGPQHTEVPVSTVESDAPSTAAPAPAPAPGGRAEIQLGASLPEARAILDQIQAIDDTAKIQWGNLSIRGESEAEVRALLSREGVSLPRIAANRGARTKPSSYRDALRNNKLMTQPQPSSGRFTLDDEVRTLGWTGKALSGKWWVRKFQDKLIRLKDTQRRIAEVMGIDDLPDEVNAYRKEEIYHGKVAEDLRDLEERHIKRIADILASKGLTHGELDLYLYAKHAPERNAWILANRDPNNTAGSGMTDQEARAILQKARNEGKTRDLESAAKVVYKMLEENRQRLEDAGLLDAQTIGEWRSDFQFYVPLQGFASLDIEPVSRTGRGFSVGGKETLSAAGRTTLADSPLAFAVHQVAEKIVRARRNEIAVAFLEMAERYPDSKLWTVYDPSKKGMAPTEKVVINGKTVERPVDFELAKRIDEDVPRFYAAKRGGKTFYVEIKDPLLNRAMHNAGVDKADGVSQILINTTGAATRFLSSMNTTLNPEFFIVNAARDIQAALFNMMAEQQIPDGKVKGKKIARQMVKDAIPSYRAFARGMRGQKGTSAADKDFDRYYAEFRSDGAMTGWATGQTVEQQQKRIERLTRIAGKGPVARTEKGARELMKWIEDRNLEIENAIRLSAYANARRNGISRDKAASLAKNLTVNFNRRGEATTVANSLFMFFNAAIQGNYQLIRSLANDPRTIGGLTMAQKAALGMVGTGVLLTLYNQAMSAIDDDDEPFYDKIPDWEKERNFIIIKPLGDGTDYVKVPLPYGYNIFHVAGVAMAEAFDGSRTAGDAALMMLHSAFDAFSPLGLPASDDLGTSVGKALTPTVALPVVELFSNENHFGSPIYRENFPTGTQLPDSALSMKNTAGWAKTLSQFLNSATGGERNVEGEIDVSPDTWEHLAEFATGGLGRFTMRSFNFAEKLAGGEEIEPRQIPFLRQVYGNPSKFENMGRYYERRHDVEQIIAEFEDRTGQRKLDWLREHRAIIKLGPIIEATESELRDIRKQRRMLEGLPPSDRNQALIDKLVDAEYRQYTVFNRAYNRATKSE